MAIGFFSKLRSMRVGDKVLVQTATIQLPGGILHEAEIVRISEGRSFVEVRYAEAEFTEWVRNSSVERI